VPYDPYTVRPRLKNRNSLAVKLGLLLVVFIAAVTAVALVGVAVALS
jgi:hypothetical protein